MLPKKGGIAAAELMAKLEADPDWVARRADRERALNEKATLLASDEAPLVAALDAAGVPVGSVWDLVNSAEPYPAAIPVLLAHLDRDYAPTAREGIARALAVREARPIAWTKLLALLSDPSDIPERVRDGLVIAICGMAEADDVPVLIELIENEALGRSRMFLVRPLMKFGHREADAALDRLGRDPDLRVEIEAARRALEKPY